MGTNRKKFIRKSITIRLDERLILKFEMYCKINEITKTKFIEDCIKEKFKELEI